MLNTTTAQPSPNKLRHVTRDRGYRFVDRDPDMVELCDIITKSGLDIGEIIEEVLDKSNNQVHIGYGTIANWMNGTTRRPSNWCMKWVAFALGYERSWKRFRHAKD